MDGVIANLKGICDLADKYGALVMVDDSHAVGFMGETGAGTPEFCGRCWTVLTCTPVLWVKPWVVLPVVTLPVKLK